MSTAKEVDREKVAKDWKARGFSCDLWVDPPGQVWEDYLHSTDELLMLMEGKLELEMQGKTFRPAIGEEVLIPARTNHSVRSEEHTSELQSQSNLVCRLLLEKKKKTNNTMRSRPQ